MIHEIIQSLWDKSSDIHPFTALITLGSILLIFFLKKISKNLPATLIVVILSTVLTALLQWDQVGLKIVGFIPQGLPSIKLQAITVQEIYQLTPMAITLALIAFLEAISIAKSVDQKNNEDLVKPNQELIALGMANVVGSFFQAYPTTGGFSRTAVNHQSGAKTGVASWVSALLVALTLVFFTDLFYHLPKAVLGAIILSAVIHLIDFKYPLHLWKTHREEFFVLLFTFTITLFLGVEEGILLGALVSLSLMVYRSAQPHIAVLGRIKGTSLFRNVVRFPQQIETFPGVFIIRFYGQLFFGNHNYFKKQITDQIENHQDPIKYLIVDAGPINYVDATASGTLQEWIQELKQKNIKVMWVKTIGPLRDIFYRNGMIKIIGRENFFPSLETVIRHIEGEKVPKIEKKISNQNNLKNFKHES